MIRQAAGGERPGGPQGVIGVGRGRASGRSNPGVIIAAQADEYAGVAAGERGRCDGRVLQRLPGNFQQQSMLRIHAGGVAGRDAEELGIEAIDLIEKRAFPHVHPPRRLRIGVVERVHVPAFRGNVGDRIRAGAEHFLEGRGTDGSARKTASEADDRDAAVIDRSRRGRACAGNGRGRVGGGRTGEMLRQLFDRGKIVEDGWRDRASEKRFQFARKRDRCQRIKSQAVPRYARIDRVGGETKRGCDALD